MLNILTVALKTKKELVLWKFQMGKLFVFICKKIGSDIPPPASIE